MQPDDLKKAAVQTANLVERLSRISQDIAERNHQAAEYLQRTTQAAPDMFRQAANAAYGNISSGTLQAVRSGLNEPLENFQRSVIDHINSIQRTTHELIQAQASMKAVIRKLSLLVAGVLATMLLAIMSGASVLWHYQGVIAKNQIQADLMRAYNQADVTLCDGQLCAKVDKPRKNYEGYVPVKPRQ
ncbi:hypothetical protein [Dyella subtropica]|uniref:hypothetical protein n=1 Tax=Dyella subtropica TaxID=2992127 RepID=UPI00224F734A|nr:hypothetical protein [Dyella subtropica]